MTQNTNVINRKYKDTIFRKLFGEDKANAQNLIGLIPDELIAEKIGLPLEEVHKMHK